MATARATFGPPSFSGKEGRRPYFHIMVLPLNIRKEGRGSGPTLLRARVAKANTEGTSQKRGEGRSEDES